MTQFLSPKVVVQEIPPKIRTGLAQPTAVLGMLGVTQKGPFGAKLYTSFAEWLRAYGGATADSLDTFCGVQGFFEEGGQFLWFSRVVHYTDIHDEDTRTSAAAETEAIMTDEPELPLEEQEALQFVGRYHGTYANTLSVQIADATNGEADHFNVLVLEDGVVIERFPNCSMAQGTSYVVTRVATSDYVQAVDLEPDLGTALLDRPLNGTYELSGGEDGLTNLADTDYIGSSVSKLGLRSFDDVADITLLCCPDRVNATVANAMLSYAEIRGGDLFVILDPPAQQTAQDIVEYVETTAQLINLTEHGAVFWPRVQILTPNVARFGADPVTVPPSGHIAGLFARVDSSQPGGVYVPAANANGRFRSIVGFELLPGRDRPESFDETKRDLVYPKRINPLDNEGPGRVIDGVLTLKGDGNFPTIAERRGVIFIERTLKQGLKTYKNRNNDEEFRAEVDRFVNAFLLSQMKVGAFRSKNPVTAFFVDCDIPGNSINSLDQQLAGIFTVDVGLATQRPAQFILLRVSQDLRAYEQELAG